MQVHFLSIMAKGEIVIFGTSGLETKKLRLEKFIKNILKKEGIEFRIIDPAFVEQFFPTDYSYISTKQITDN